MPFDRIPSASTRLRLAFLLIALAGALYFIQSRLPLQSHRHAAGPTITYRHPTPAIAFLALPPTLTLAASLLLASTPVKLYRYLVAPLTLFASLAGLLSPITAARNSVTITPTTLILPQPGLLYPHLTLQFSNLLGVLITQDPKGPGDELHLYKRDGTHHTLPIQGPLRDSLPDLHPALQSHQLPAAS